MNVRIITESLKKIKFVVYYVRCISMAIEVQTTQNVVINYETAGIGYRMLAYITDWVVIVIWILAWMGLFYSFRSYGILDIFNSLSGIYMFIYVLIFLPAFLYDLIFETLNNGQSIGKMLFKIRVVNTDGTTPSIGAYLLRWLFRFVDFWISQWLVGVVTIAVSKNSQRLGDIIAGTTVIDLKKTSKNKELSAFDLDFKEDYNVTYTDILDKLSDRDIQTVLSVLNDEKMWDNKFINNRLVERIKQVTGYQYEGNDRAFLKKIVDDYNFLALQS